MGLKETKPGNDLAPNKIAVNIKYIFFQVFWILNLCMKTWNPVCPKIYI